MEKILIAEDSPALANLLEYILSKAGFQVSLFRNGTLACEAAAREQSSFRKARTRDRKHIHVQANTLHR